MHYMFFFNIVVHQYIIHIRRTEIVQIFFQRNVNENLKNFERIAKIKKHYDIFEQLSRSEKNRFVLVLFANFNFVKCDSNVEFAVEFDNA